MLLMLAVGWQAPALRGEEAGHFREVASVPIIAAVQEDRVQGRQFNSGQPSGLNKLAIELSSSVDAGFILALPFQGGLCAGLHGITMPLQDFMLKMKGWHMREGGRICGTLQYKHLNQTYKIIGKPCRNIPICMYHYKLKTVKVTQESISHSSTSNVYYI